MSRPAPPGRGLPLQKASLLWSSSVDSGVVRAPVLIVGGGPVGLYSSALLSAYGVPSVLVERRRTGSQHPRAHLVNTRSIYIMPSANAWGYFHETRVERLDGKSMDPNRDFGYDRNSNCMETTAARAVNELWAIIFFLFCQCPLES